MTHETSQPGETRLFTASNVPIGHVPGEAYGFKSNLLVTVDVRLDRKLRERETVDHATVDGYDDFAITSDVWRPSGVDTVAGGATVEPLREVVNGGRLAGRMDAATVEAIADLDAWHLNGMQAGCAHQTVVWEDSRYGRRPSLDGTPPCPESGYKYGHAWLVRPLPDGFLDGLRTLFAGADQSRIYDYARDNYIARGYDAFGNAI